MTGGNLATAQATLNHLQKDIARQSGLNLNTVSTIGEAADYIGAVYREQLEEHGTVSPEFEASFLLGGQIQGSNHRVVKIYEAGNHITSSRDTPFLQIGESKYGTPILDRIISRETSLDTSALCSLVSMASTMNSNPSVGPPIEIMLYQANSYKLENYHRFEEDDDFLRDLNKEWANKLMDAFNQLPPLAWAPSWDKVAGNSKGIF